MRRLLTTLLTLAVLGAAGAFVGAPFAAFFALRSAAQAQDVQGLNELVDYDAVRASLRAQVSGTAAAAPAPSVWQDPIGALRRSIEPVQAAPVVDSYLTPPALYRLTKAPDGSEPIPSVRYWGVNRCRLAVPATGGETIFTFERKALYRWRLVHLGLPSKAAP